MTPFDPMALLAMLLAFYPVVSPAALARARVERPEYFAGGTLIGHSGDALRLPDGTIWDLIFSVGAPAGVTHWQAIIPGGGDGAAADPFALEAGPLTPLDEDALQVTLSGPSFEGIVADELSAFGASDELLHAAATAAAEFDTGDLERASGELLDPAVQYHEATAAALVGDPLVELLETTDDSGRVIDDALPELEQQLPDDVDEPVIPGEPPPPTTPDHGEPPPPRPAPPI